MHDLGRPPSDMQCQTEEKSTVQNKVYDAAESQLEAAMKRIERRREDDDLYGRNQPVRRLPRQQP